VTELAALLEASVKQMARYVVLPGEAEQTALALFVAHTYAIEGAHSTPYLLVTSPERESGKTRMLENLELQVAQPWRVTGASESAMFRKIQSEKPTLMLDEIDAIFGTFSERTEPLRCILNAGNRPGAAVSRCTGDKHEVVDFSVYCPKVLAGIDTGKRIPETIRSRSIPIRMQRKTSGEEVEHFRYRFVKAECEPLRRALDAWALGACDLLLEAVPELPEDLGDRAAEGWEPLLAIADMAGGDWPAKARKAAIELSAPNDDSDQTYGALLLEAIKAAIGTADRITSADLLDWINGDEDLPFGAWRDGKGLDGRTLNKLLRPYGVKSRTIDLPDQGHKKLKGYLREQLSEAWDRWLTPSDKAVTSVTSVTETAEELRLEAHQQAEVTDVTAVTANTNGGTATPEMEEEAERIAAKMGELP
jgi:hypothetical protein